MFAVICLFYKRIGDHRDLHFRPHSFPTRRLSDLHTLRDWRRYTVTQFNASKLSFGHGNDSAWDEAVYLLLHTLHLPLDTLDPFLDARVLPEERERFLTLVERRKNERLPAAYLTVEAWRHGYRFPVDPSVIDRK